MKHLHRYLGKLVRLRPASFAALLAAARRRGLDLENRFLVAAVSGRKRFLVCYGADLRLVVSPARVELV
ncbi:MAG: hypothetical protein OHK0026_02770 [Rhodocyclaceae bacterium]